MIKDIQYSGYSAAPSDYECADGTLSMSLNLICEDGAVKPLPEPDIAFRVDTNEKVVYIHNVGGIDQVILVRPNTADGIDVMWSEAGAPPQGHASNVLLFSCGSLYDVTSIGNVLSFATDRGLLYVIWRDGEYVFLGARPELPVFGFGLERAESVHDRLVDHDFEIAVDKEVFDALPNRLPGTPGSGATRPRRGFEASANKVDRFFEDISNAVYGAVFDGYARAVADGDFKFYQPFFVRYAFRLYDGSYLWHSSPVLMLPTTVPPVVTSDAGTWADGIYKGSVNASAVYTFSLLFKTLVAGNLSLWKDIITDIDFFVSAPLYTFDQSKSVTGYGTTKYQKTKSYGSTRGRNGNKYTVATCRRLDGIYRTSSTDAFDWHFVTDTKCWIFPAREDELLDDIRHTHLFYRIARLAVKDIPATSEPYAPLIIEPGVSPSSLVARPTLPDDFNSMHLVMPEILHSYNKRLHVADFALQLAPAPPLAALVPAGSADDSRITYTPEVSYRKDGESLKSVRTVSEGDSLPSPEIKPPVFVYLPDIDADCLSVYPPCADGETIGFDFPLTPHDNLNGAYFFNGFDFPVDGVLSSHFDSTDPVPSPSLPRVFRRSSVYVSEVNNPFVFPASFAFSVGADRIMALASAAKALSQGQFGQFPLYAFTDNGVWATELTASGTYSARQPITRDVCINTKGITQIDSAVLFPTDRGIMLLTGSQTECISDVIASEMPFDNRSLPYMSKLHNAFGHYYDDRCIDILPFSEFLASCRMIYDYVHRHIIVYKPGCSYSYVYSLKSKLWGMLRSDIVDNINSYPNALAMDSAHNIVDFSLPVNTDVKALLVTRPLKLDNPDILKTVDMVIQRGFFRKGKVKSVLYGSRDLFSWHMIWSSDTHFLRGFSGTPYKYFRIALLCDFAADERLFGPTVSFNPKYTNQPR